ncbi:MAG TPA: hypothetical protein VL171_01580 [Verrucomicrobiae bacterium]|nr:hypothetical protein [Verrucomicrobiae bacterium]
MNNVAEPITPANDAARFSFTPPLCLGVRNAVRVSILALVLACSGCVVWRSDVTCEISGKVLDQITKQPVPGAKLYDKRYPKHVVTTSADGSFDFPRIMAWHHVNMLFPGPDLTKNHFFVIEAPGYHKAEICMPLQFDWFDRIIYLTPITAVPPTATTPLASTHK